MISVTDVICCFFCVYLYQWGGFDLTCSDWKTTNTLQFDCVSTASSGLQHNSSKTWGEPFYIFILADVLSASLSELMKPLLMWNLPLTSSLILCLCFEVLTWDAKQRKPVSVPLSSIPSIPQQEEVVFQGLGFPNTCVCVRAVTIINGF